MDVGARVRAARTRCGHTLEFLSKRTGIGISALSRVEGGKRTPSFDEVCRIAIALGWPLLYFATGRTESGNDPRELIAQLAFRGIHDLLAAESVLIGEARSVEDLLTTALSDGTSSRIVESTPALLLANDLNPGRLVAIAKERNVLRRVGWIAELAEWIASRLSVSLSHPTARDTLRTIRMVAWDEFSERFLDPFAADWDSLGRPLPGALKRLVPKLSPIHKKWSIWYETPQEEFLARTQSLLERQRG